MNLGLKNKIVVVTGSTGGIGEAICKAALQEEAIVVPLHRGSESRLHALFDWIKENDISKENCQPQQLDLKESTKIPRVVNQIISKHGKIDVLVNCAGRSIEKPFLLHEDHDFNEMLQVNLINTAILTREVVKRMMKKRSGNIINISSILSHKFGRGVSAYAAAKAGMDRMTESLAAEMGKKGIRVNSVCPGVIETKMSSDLTLRMGDELIERTPLMRYGKPEDIANAVLFLASDKMAPFITGQRLDIDGGLGLL